MQIFCLLYQTYQTVPCYVKANGLTIHSLLTLNNAFTCHFPSNSTPCLFLKTSPPHYSALKAIESIEFYGAYCLSG